MDFVTWWFDEHYILSTLFTPGFTLGWCIYKGLVIRGIVTFCIWFLFSTKFTYNSRD